MDIFFDEYYGDILEKKLLNDLDINDSTMNNIFNKEKFLFTYNYYQLNKEYEYKEKLLYNEYNYKLNIDNVYFKEKYKKYIYNDYLDKYNKLKIDYLESRKIFRELQINKMNNYKCILKIFNQRTKNIIIDN